MADDDFSPVTKVLVGAAAIGFMWFAYSSTVEAQQESSRALAAARAEYARSRRNPGRKRKRRNPHSDPREQAIEDAMGVIHGFDMWNKRMRVHRTRRGFWIDNMKSVGDEHRTLKFLDAIADVAELHSMNLMFDGNDMNFEPKLR